MIFIQNQSFTCYWCLNPVLFWLGCNMEPMEAYAHAVVHGDKQPNVLADLVEGMHL